jgi:hypothetical protein
MVEEFQKQMREYLKDKINDLATHSKKQTIRDIYGRVNEYKNCYLPITNLVKDENGGLIADSHNILNR